MIIGVRFAPIPRPMIIIYLGPPLYTEVITLNCNVSLSVNNIQLTIPCYDSCVENFLTWTSSGLYMVKYVVCTLSPWIIYCKVLRQIVRSTVFKRFYLLGQRTYSLSALYFSYSLEPLSFSFFYSWVYVIIHLVQT